jgi:glycosyltransferase involved in cell wall biosynthesis
MRLLVVSHPCVTPINQDFFGRLRQAGNWTVDIVLPERWRNEYGDLVARRSHHYQGGLHPVPVLARGSVPLHLYRTRVRRIVDELNPDLVYLHHEPYALATIQWALALRERVPFGCYAAQNLYKIYPQPVRAAERLVHRYARFVLPVSEEADAVLRRRGYVGASEVLPLPIDTTVFEYQADHSANPPVIGYVGRLSEEKGVDTLLEACARIVDLDYRCVVAGDGPARAQLHGLANRLRLDDRVQWVGYIDHRQAGRVYGGVNVIVVPSKTTPSWKEQFGRVVVEALAAGVPVITSDSGELPSLVSRTSGGWTFPEGNVEGLARQLRMVITEPDLRRRVGGAGQAYVHRYLDLDFLAARFSAALRPYASPRGESPNLNGVGRAELRETVRR